MQQLAKLEWCREGDLNPHRPFGPADFKSNPFVLQTLQFLYFTNTCGYVCVLTCTVLFGHVKSQWSEFGQRGRAWKLAFTGATQLGQTTAGHGAVVISDTSE